jgi:chorismate-pyruvate lyase
MRGHGCIDRAPEIMTGVSPAVTAEVMAALEHTEQTVTEFLEDLASEPVDAEIITQRAGPAGGDNWLGLAPQAELVRRAVLLTGRSSKRAFVYAESSIAPERLPSSVRQRLERSRDPIGRVLVDQGVQVRREPLDGPVAAEGVGDEVENLLRESALSRRYRIMIGDFPAIVVSEWFLRAAAEAIASRPRSPARRARTSEP